MKRSILLFLAFIAAGYANTQPKVLVKTGENFITVNGERFHNEKIMLKPNASGYDNLWFDSGRQKFTDINLVGKYDGRSVNFQLRFPGQTGTYTIENNRNSTGSQNNDNNCYLIMGDKDTYGDGLGAQTGSVTVSLIRYDAVGGLIEGTVNGQLITGARNDVPITISGKFSVERSKDRKSF